MGKNQDPGSGINIPDPQHWNPGFNFDADLNPTFHCNADPDPASQNDAIPCGFGYAYSVNLPYI